MSCESLVAQLQNCGQGHLFAAAGSQQNDSDRLLQQLKQLDDAFPGGLVGYVTRARKLLEDATTGKNPYGNYSPEIPDGVSLQTGSDEYMSMEQVGAENAHKLAFCLVAGGLGERLGYPGIKVGLPVETVTNMTYLEFYLRMIRSISSVGISRGNDVPGGCCPLAIMTSGDTHEKTLKLLEQINYGGMPKELVTVMQQQKVPALSDSSARFAVQDDDPFTVQTKPHGHGDVHVLLHQHGLPKKWLSEGRTHMLIFQDTNALVCHAILPMLGVSVVNQLVMNSLCIARRPKDAVGAICKLRPRPGVDSAPITINVEYNYLESLLAESPLKGDVADPKTGQSPFPGNANVLMMQLAGYDEVLNRSKGIVPEFVNPKYQDAERTTFKSPTRLECLMQDLPKLFSKKETAGFTMLDRWCAFSTVKNSVVEAVAKCARGSNPEAPFTAEADQSNCNAQLLRLAAAAVGCSDVNIAKPTRISYLGIDYEMGPTIVLDPLFAVSLTQLRERLAGCRRLRITLKSLLCIKSPLVQVKDLVLDGSFIVEDEGKAVVIEKEVQNSGHERQLVQDIAGGILPPHIKIRGYRYTPITSS